MTFVMMPTTGIASVETFDLMHYDTITRLRSGAARATNIAPATWKIAMTTAALDTNSARYRSWRSFLDGLRGSKKSGLFYDPDHPYPSYYRATKFTGLVIAGGSTPFDGTATIDTFTSRYEVDISDLPANFVLQATDYIGFVDGDYRSLHRIMTDVTADSSGDATITVEPRVPDIFDTASTVNFARPTCLAILEANSINAPRGLESQPISFKAESVPIWGTSS